MFQTASQSQITWHNLSFFTELTSFLIFIAKLNSMQFFHEGIHFFRLGAIPQDGALKGDDNWDSKN